MFSTIDFWITVICTIVAMNIYKWIYVTFFADGVLKIDHHNPSKDVYKIEIGDLDRLSKKKRIVLKVDPNADLSQK